MLSEAYGGGGSHVFEWHTRSKKAHMSKSQMKILFITFVSMKGIVLFEFITQGKSVNQIYYVQILKWLRETVCRERPELCPTDWILYYDNGPVHKALPVKQFLAQKSITEMEHPPSSPDLAWKEFWLFQKIKSAFKGTKISGC